MIEISLSLALSLYLGLFLITTLLLWLFFHRRRKIKLPSLFKLYVCAYCHFPYLDNVHKTVTQCPQCQLFNKKS